MITGGPVGAESQPSWFVTAPAVLRVLRRRPGQRGILAVTIPPKPPASADAERLVLTTCTESPARC
jgi:hypothetical protein